MTRCPLPPLVHCRSASPLRTLVAFGCCLTLTQPAMSQRAPEPTPSGPQLRVVGGLGYTMVHLPSFSYMRDDRLEVEREQDGGGFAVHAGLELLRGMFVGGARFQLVTDPMADGWSATVGSVYAGAERRRSRSVVSAALGATVISREQVTREEHWCLYDCGAGPGSGGSLTSGGFLAMLSAERRLGNTVGVGMEGYAATGRQRYAGFILRLTIGQSPVQPVARSPSTHSRSAPNNPTKSANW